VSGGIHVAAGTIVGGDFRVESPLSAGGMGTVYVAEQLSTGKKRALKLMRTELVGDVRNRQRFVDEAKVGARIDSEHVVEVIAAGVDEASAMPWLAMELLSGTSLDEVVRARGALPLHEVIEIFGQLGHALGQAHDLGIIHRDLKPENLFLARGRRKGEAPVVKILDFGIAAFVTSDRTAATATSAIGSPLWIAPEQMQTGAQLRAATDVWALGLIAFFLLTGRSYWPAANAPVFNLHALVGEILGFALAPASDRARELGTTVPYGFDAWFARCVVREPERRFTNAREAVAELAALAGYAGTAPMPYAHPVRMVEVQPVRREGSSMIGIVIAACAIVGVCGIGSFAALFAWSPWEDSAPEARTPAPIFVPTIAPSAPSMRTAAVDAGAVVPEPVAMTPIAPIEPAPIEPTSIEPAPIEPTPIERPERPPIPERPPVERPPLDPPAEEGNGTLRVNTTPWTEVYVDGRLIGNTPQMNISLPAGRHVLLLINREHEIRETMSVVIRAGQTQSIIRRLGG
jgi:tRNA A-37 threonylcarbamoyl transferase component Bud32